MHNDYTQIIISAILQLYTLGLYDALGFIQDNGLVWRLGGLVWRLPGLYGGRVDWYGG